MLGRRCRAALQGVSTLRLGRVDTARRRWSRPLCGSASIRTSDPKSRRVEVTGTTWTTDGAPSSSRCAVTTTAGCRYPASRPTGVPRSTVTTSPEVSIEPGDIRCVRVGTQVLGDLVLTQAPHGECDRVTDAGAQSRGQSLQLAMRRDVDPYAGALHAHTLAGLHAHAVAVRARRLDLSSRLSN